jgi:predicted AlkP superfamily pyrophosphatase or phosphodiesterase
MNIAKVTLLAATLVGSFALDAPLRAATVLMVSVDGMKPEYVTRADEHGLKIPYLRRLMAEGSYADGVEGVWPTVTYPSHTTLLTGVSPAEHGIYNNLEFDPRHTFGDAWFWYAHEIRVPTLWQAAHRAGLATASVGWPVSVGATDVDFLIPEYWRIFRPTEDSNPADRELIADLSRPEGLLRGMEAALGPYLMGNDTGIAADETKTRFAVDILRHHNPRFMTIHLSSLDDAEHAHGPFSGEANADLEAIDGMLSRLVAAARSNDPAAIAVVVSDHGFVGLTHLTHLYVPFLEAGLIDAKIDADTKAVSVKEWKAVPWTAGGMAAVVLHDPGDPAQRQKVRDVLRTLAVNAEYGIATVLERHPDDEPAGVAAGDAIAERGGFPTASFLVVMKPGYYLGSNTSGPIVTPLTGHGGHGFAPSDPDMRAALFMAGTGIARHRDLGLIDMRQIAPTVASLLGVPMPTAKAQILAVRQ